MEIVSLAEQMGKSIDKAKFWKLFNSIDHDNSADLDEDEFVKILNQLTMKVCLRPRL
jgi:Ca2+-binding EF-hand superfamily protein